MKNYFNIGWVTKISITPYLTILSDSSCPPSIFQTVLPVTENTEAWRSINLWHYHSFQFNYISINIKHTTLICYIVTIIFNLIICIPNFSTNYYINWYVIMSLVAQPLSWISSLPWSRRDFMVLLMLIVIKFLHHALAFYTVNNI